MAIKATLRETWAGLRALFLPAVKLQRKILFVLRTVFFQLKAKFRHFTLTDVGVRGLSGAIKRFVGSTPVYRAVIRCYRVGLVDIGAIFGVYLATTYG